MYRVISFWLVLVVGWVLWGQLAFQVRRGRWTRHALEAPVEAELGPDGARRSRVDRGRRDHLGGRAVRPPGRRRGGGSAQVGGRRRPAACWLPPFSPDARRRAAASARLTARATSPCRRRPRRSSRHGRFARRAEVLDFGAPEEGSPPPARPRHRLRPDRKRSASSRSRGSSRPASVSDARGRSSGHLAVVVSTTPGNHLLGTVIFTKAPLHFGHSHVG